jgi:hypothetical protein
VNYDPLVSRERGSKSRKATMFLRNTSPYPDDEVKRLVKFATKGVNMKKVCVNVKGSSHRWGGRAYGYVPSMSNAPPSAEYLISLRIGSPFEPIPEKNYHGESPEDANPSGRFPFYRLDTWQELRVSLGTSINSVMASAIAKWTASGSLSRR